MVAFRTKIFSVSESGAGIIEVILTIAILAVIAPFIYSQIVESSNNVRNITIAKNIIGVRDNVLNFVRLNQDSWPDVAQIKLSDEELKEISEFAKTGFIDKYKNKGATITDVYLAFDLKKNRLNTNTVAHYIGNDAAIVNEEGIAYSETWAVAAPGFDRGDLIYRMSRDISGKDKSKYLHRGVAAEDKLNIMERDLNMGGNNLYDIGTIFAKSAKVKNVLTMFMTAETFNANNIYFSSGANLAGKNSEIGTLRVTGDISGFRNIYAESLNGSSYTPKGQIIADRATITDSVNVGHNLELKSDSVCTVGAFSNVITNSVTTTYLLTDQIVFSKNFGLTVSDELLRTGITPLQIGNWSFSSKTPPRFSNLSLGNGNVRIPQLPDKSKFEQFFKGD